VSGGVTQQGVITPGDVAVWVDNGVVADGGAPLAGRVGRIGIQANNTQSLGIADGPPSGAFHGLTLGVSSTAGYASINLGAYNGAGQLPLYIGNAGVNSIVINADGTVTIPNLTYTAELGVKLYGAVGNGVADDTAALQACANAQTDVFFPPGTYATSSPIVLRSGTTVHCEPGQATIVPIPTATFNVGGVSLAYCAFTNQNNGATTLTDSDIQIDGLTFDWRAWFANPASGGFAMIRMSYVSRVRVWNCKFIGLVNGTVPYAVSNQLGTYGDATAMIGCYDTLVERCWATGATNSSYDHWGGIVGARVVNCVSYISGQWAILITGTFNQTASNYSLQTEVLGCTVYNPLSIGVWIQDDGTVSFPAGSSLARVVSNHFDGCGEGVRVSGQYGGCVISDNVFVNGKASGTSSGGAAVNLTNDSDNTTPNSCIVSNNVMFNWNAASANGLMSISGSDHFISGNSAIGGIYNFLIYATGTSNATSPNNGTGLVFTNNRGPVGINGRYTAITTGQVLILDPDNETGAWNFSNPVSQLRATVSATGTNQATALQTTTPFVNISGGAANAGVLLLATSFGGVTQAITNTSGTTFIIYPQSGEAIQNLGTNAGISIYNNQTLVFEAVALGLWAVTGGNAFWGPITISNELTVTGFTPAGITISQSAASTAGAGLDLFAGSAGAGTNLNGGYVVLSGGTVTGNGVSGVQIEAAGGGSSGTGTTAPVLVANFQFPNSFLGNTSGTTDLQGVIVLPGTVEAAVTSGATISPGLGTSWIDIQSGGTLSSLTINLSAVGTVIGQVVSVASEVAISSLAFAGATVSGAPTSLVAYSGFALRYNGTAFVKTSGA